MVKGPTDFFYLTERGKSGEIVIPLVRLHYMAKVMGSHFCDYITLYKTPVQQTEVRDSSAGFEELSCYIVSRPVMTQWQGTSGASGGGKQVSKTIGISVLQLQETECC